MKGIKKLTTCTLILMLSATGLAGNSYSAQKEKNESAKAQIMLFGTFHFSNPGRDYVKSEVIDVLTPENQDYIEGLTSKLASQSPTHVMLECDPSQQKKINKEFTSYLAGEHQLKNNENEQLGFRIAQKASLSEVICYDENEVHYNGEALRAYMEKYESERNASNTAFFKELSKETGQRHKTLTLKKLLQLNNDPTEDQQNMNLYLMNNDIAAGEAFAGADASASWWHRNFRMYANIQAKAQPGAKIIVIAGSGHTAIMKTLLATDLQRQAWDINDYL
ncbi:DUF5694 domain-containing protein [Microbulbifer variabilis]|uniref:DUF5694 domain-containing protein n=1 Tax=Microbulbifer variabilis TaxID=266805 RepID=UPI001CFE84CC|nr:DUF5694 domain-containing protein [Microbulbifer variabilis]